MLCYGGNTVQLERLAIGAKKTWERNKYAGGRREHDKFVEADGGIHEDPSAVEGASQNLLHSYNGSREAQVTASEEAASDSVRVRRPGARGKKLAR